jgi:hypothetical protein
MKGTLTQTSSTWELIRIPAMITLVVTVLRLVGELQHWSHFWFNAQPGGGGALIGIVWLAPIFGIYFALKLQSMGETPKIGRTIGFVVIGLVVIVGGSFLANAIFHGRLIFIIVANLIAGVGGLIQLYGWPSLSRILLAYGFAARIPVAIVMFFAIKGNWGTHYDGPPPGFPEMGWFPKFLIIGALPQLLLWVAFTMIIGALVGAIAVAIARKRSTSLQPAS